MSCNYSLLPKILLVAVDTGQERVDADIGKDDAHKPDDGKSPTWGQLLKARYVQVNNFTFRYANPLSAAEMAAAKRALSSTPSAKNRPLHDTLPSGNDAHCSAWLCWP